MPRFRALKRIIRLKPGETLDQTLRDHLPAIAATGESLLVYTGGAKVIMQCRYTQCHECGRPPSMAPIHRINQCATCRAEWDTAASR